MNVLIACEESQRVCIEFRRLGHRAFSCDIQDQTGGHPEWHIKGDALPLINGNCKFQTQDGKTHKQDGKWDMLIAFPPCTYLIISGNRWFNEERYGEQAKERWAKRLEAIHFFTSFAEADCERIAIENPVGVINTLYRNPDQIIQPWMFGDHAEKTTCLWLFGLPLLIPDTSKKPKGLKRFKWVDRKTGRQKSQPLWYAKAWINNKSDNSARSKERSKTFPGIARAMAEQWGNGIIKTKEPYQLYFDGYV